MKVVLFGGSGMVGQGVLRECLLASDVQQVLSVVRKPTGQAHEKLRELVHDDFSDFSKVAVELGGFDACFWCLGVTSAGMSEADYTRVTHQFAMAAAQVLANANPGMTFVFVSGAGTDSTERGRTMWARVKGRAENDLAKLPFKLVVSFRPAFIQPKHGIVSRTRAYRAFYAVMSPLYPLFKSLAPRYVTTTEIVGQAMLKVAREGTDRRIFENADINALMSS
ncbi:MAG: epimerase [Deltaproteobacteria bacterium]|nr:epimerase [Deltaproteobacteria bacterium]